MPSTLPAMPFTPTSPACAPPKRTSPPSTPVSLSVPPPPHPHPAKDASHDPSPPLHPAVSPSLARVAGREIGSSWGGGTGTLALFVLSQAPCSFVQAYSSHCTRRAWHT